MRRRLRDLRAGARALRHGPGPDLEQAGQLDRAPREHEEGEQPDEEGTEDQDGVERMHGVAPSELNERYLFDDALALHCHASHPLAARARLTWHDLKGADLIMVRSFTATRLRSEYHLLTNGVSTSGDYGVQYHSTAVNLVEAGVGCAVLPCSVLGTGAGPNIRRIQLGGPVIHRRVMLFTRKKASLSPAAQAFVDLVLAQFGKRALAAGSALTGGCGRRLAGVGVAQRKREAPANAGRHRCIFGGRAAMATAADEC